MSSIKDWTKTDNNSPDQGSMKLWRTSLILGLLLAVGAGVGVSYLQAIERFYVIGGVIGALLMIVILFRPQLGAYLLIITIFANISDLMTESGLPSINQPLAAIMLVVVIANLIIAPERITPLKRFSRVEWALTAYVIVVILSLTVASNRVSATEQVLDLVKNAVILVIIFLSLNTRKKLRTAVWIMIVTMTILVSLGVIQNILNLDFTFWGLSRDSVIGQVTESGEARYGGPLGLANIWGQVLVVVLPYFIYRVVDAKNNRFGQFVMIVATLTLFLAIILTGSRGAYIALFAILPLLAMELKIRIPTIFISLAVGVIILLALPQDYTARFTSLVTGTNELGGTISEDPAVRGRITKMRTGLEMFVNNPVLGVGVGNFADAYWDYADDIGVESDAQDIQSEEEARDAHSLYIEVLAETGILGFVTFMLFFYFLLADSFKALMKVRGKIADHRWKSWVAPIVISLIAYLVSGLFLHGVVFRWFWVIAALALTSIHLTELKFEKT